MSARLVLASLAALWLGACDDGDTRPAGSTANTTTTAHDTTATGPSEPSGTEPVGAGPIADRFPDVVAVDATYDDASSTWTFDVTMSSPYDTPDRYADGWRVVGPGGVVYGTHTLAHDHANEQPFTRRQTGVEIPDDVDEVTIEGRDLANGFGGATVTVSLDPG